MYPHLRGLILGSKCTDDYLKAISKIEYEVSEAAKCTDSQSYIARQCDTFNGVNGELHKDLPLWISQPYIRSDVISERNILS